MIPNEQLKALLVLHEQRRAQKADRNLNRALGVALLALLALLAYRQLRPHPEPQMQVYQIHLP
jgi:uncharacterized membrane protein